MIALEPGGVGHEAVQAWAAGLDAVAERIRRHFARREAHARAMAYIRALLSPVERKNAWQLAESIGATTPYGLQHVLGRAAWDADRVRDELREYVIDTLGDPDGILVIDETSVPKKGTQSVGVARQYCGSLGKKENCQVGVLLAYASQRGHAFIDRELYLPKGWIDDPARLRAAGVPEEVTFQTKPQIAKRMLERALDAGMPARWVTADEVCGADSRLRSCLEARRQRYVLGVAANHYVWAEGSHLRVDELLRGRAEEEWSRLSCGEGSKGPRVYDWTAARITCPVAGWERWALARRSIANPEELAYYLVFVPAGTALEEVVRVAGRRWTIEEGIEEAKGEVGLDQYEVRSWRGWYRHVTLALLAHAFLAATRAAAGGLPKGGMRTPTGSLAEFKRRRGLAG